MIDGLLLWPKLESLPEMTEKGPLWKQVRRVVWCVNRKKMGPRDVIDWLSRFWQDTPIRIALFRATSFVQGREGRGGTIKGVTKGSAYA